MTKMSTGRIINRIAKHRREAIEQALSTLPPPKNDAEAVQDPVALIGCAMEALRDLKQHHHMYIEALGGIEKYVDELVREMAATIVAARDAVVLASERQ